MAWTEFIAVAEASDLDAPSRLPGWSGRDVCTHLGSWPDHRTLTAVLDSARSGRPGVSRTEDGNARAVAAHRTASRDDVLGALHDSREAVDDYFRNGLVDEVGHHPGTSVLGPLPVTTIVFAGCYELAVHALDLAPCGTVPPSQPLLYAGLGALADTTAALAHRQAIELTVSVQAPDGGWVLRSGARGWETAERAAGPVAGAAILGAAATLLDVSAGRQQVPALLLSGRLRAQGMSTLLRLAPIVERVPGLPGRSALRIAVGSLNGAGRLLSRFPVRRR